MRQDVIARQVRAMKDAGLDAVLSISPENFDGSAGGERLSGLHHVDPD